jgi:hypothetical protein
MRCGNICYGSERRYSIFKTQIVFITMLMLEAFHGGEDATLYE